MSSDKTVRVAGIQMPVGQNVDENLEHIVRNIKRAGEDGAAFVLFPEMSLSGYFGGFDHEATLRGLDRVVEATRAAGSVTIVGAGERVGEKTFNQCRIYGPDGSLVGVHTKIMATTGDREWSEPGEKLDVFEYEGLRFGVLICNDFWVTPGGGPEPDPRLSLQLSQRGARVIFHAINSGGDADFRDWHESNLRLRAREGKLWVCTANACAEGGVNCPSGVVRPDGSWLTTVSRHGEQYYCADLRLEPEG